ncbi:response regulator [bacterium]|nr:response regulator [bacterium]
MPRILLVDDEKNVLKTLSMGLRRLSYGVEEAQTGPEALKLLEKQSVDVVVSDIRMSPMDGYALAREVHKRHPQIPVILMSAYGFESQQVEEKDGIIYPKLTKPFSVHQLVEKLKEVEQTWKPHALQLHRHILVFSDHKAMKEIDAHLRTSGFVTVGARSRDEFLKQLENSQFDCVLIDEACMQDTEWKILNDLDSHAPNKPVLLLVEGPGSASHTLRDMKVTMLDREKFFEDRTWMERCFDENVT